MPQKAALQLLLVSLVHNAEKCFSAFSRFLPTNVLDLAEYNRALCLPVLGTVHEANVDGMYVCMYV